MNFLLEVNFVHFVLGGSEDDARSACPSDALGYTHNTMATTTGRDVARLSQSYKSGPSSDWGLKLDPMKLESLVIAGQLYRGEYVLKSCTQN